MFYISETRVRLRTICNGLLRRIALAHLLLDLAIGKRFEALAPSCLGVYCGDKMGVLADI